MQILLSNFSVFKLNKRLLFKLPYFQRHCLLCGESDAASRHAALCSACHLSLPHLSAESCPVCALPASQGQVCGACLADSPAFDFTVAALRYAFPADALIHALKYRGDLALTRTLADLLSAKIIAVSQPDCLLPMPLHPTRLRERGFNQALEIARALAKTTSVDLLADACERIRDTPPQIGLPWKARTRNMRGAFACAADLRGLHVAMVDDVMTTGATLNELATVLKKCGATQVSAWVVARTLGRDRT